MAAEARLQGAQAIVAVGTAGLRAAVNAADFLAVVTDGAGVTVEVISGEAEARLAYAAAVQGAGALTGPVAVFDTGGGSSQFTFGDAGRVDERFSVPLGAVAVTERFGLDGRVDGTTLDEARAAVAEQLARIAGRPARTVVGMGGAVTNLAAVRHRLARYDPEVVQGTSLDRAELGRQIELYRSLDAAGRRELPGVQPGRAAVILAGALIVDTVLALLGAGGLTVSDRGLRHGVLEERFGAGPAVAPARRAATARG